MPWCIFVACTMGACASLGEMLLVMMTPTILHSEHHYCFRASEGNLSSAAVNFPRGQPVTML